MTGGEWTTQRERRQSRDEAREAKRRLTIEWADKLWLAQNHPCADSVLAWLSENRAEASKIGASRWNLETLPALVKRQGQLRKAAKFEEVLRRASISNQTVTVQDVLGEFSTIPQNQPAENENGAAQALQRPRRSDAGKARPSRKTRQGSA
jgi:hypothetical protein